MVGGLPHRGGLLAEKVAMENSIGMIARDKATPRASNEEKRPLFSIGSSFAGLYDT